MRGFISGFQTNFSPRAPRGVFLPLTPFAESRRCSRRPARTVGRRCPRRGWGTLLLPGVTSAGCCRASPRHPRAAPRGGGGGSPARPASAGQRGEGQPPPGGTDRELRCGRGGWNSTPASRLGCFGENRGRVRDSSPKIRLVLRERAASGVALDQGATPAANASPGSFTWDAAHRVWIHA